MRGKEQGPEFYDQSFLSHGHWLSHYTDSQYYPMWAIIADRISRAKVKSVLDIGCGPGQVAALLHEKGLPKYLGIDFSHERIRRAREVCREFDFMQADIFETDLLRTCDYDAVVCFEFLEHVERDLQVIEALRPGTLFYGSVPNFGATQHVRHFRNAFEVAERYAAHFDDFSIDEHRANDKGRMYFLIEGVRARSVRRT